MKIKSWHEHQPYRDGRPVIWIKLYKALLDDYEWGMLDGDAAKMLINLWLLAAENEGQLPDEKVIAYRLHTTIETVRENFVRLSHWLCTDPYESVRTPEAPRTDPCTRVRVRDREDIDKEEEEEGECERVPDAGAPEEVDAAEMFLSPEEAPPSKPDIPATHNRVLQAWDTTATAAGLPRCVALTPKRKAALRARMAEAHWKENWEAALTKLASSAFCTGSNDRQWKADIDFFLRPDSVARLIEGKYDDRTPRRSSTWRPSDDEVFPA